MLNLHFFEHLAGKLLQLADLDRSALQPISVAGGGAEFTYWAQSSARKAERIIAEDGLGSSVVVLVLDLVDERTDVDADGAGLLTWTVCALHASRCLGNGLPLRVNPVVEVPSPVIVQILLRNPLELDLMLLTVLLSGLSVNDLRLVEMRSSGQHACQDFWREFGQAKAADGSRNNL